MSQINLLNKSGRTLKAGDPVKLHPQYSNSFLYAELGSIVIGTLASQTNRGSYGVVNLLGSSAPVAITPEQLAEIAERVGSNPGPKGNDGDTGLQGLKGDQGNPGTNGTTPVKNIDYFDGSKGDKGDIGNTGLKGDNGTQGIQGNIGTTGQNGSDATVTKPAVELALTGEIATHTHASNGLTLSTVKADTDIASAISLKHAVQDLSGKVDTNDSRLSDTRTPVAHSHAPGDVTGTAIINNDSRLSDARTPTTHNHDTLYNPKRLFTNLAAPVVSSGTTEKILLQLVIPANNAVVGSTYRAWIIGNSSSTGTLIFKVRCGAGGTITDTITWTAVTSAAQVANARAGFDALITIRSGTTIKVEGIGYAGTVQLPTTIAAPATQTIAISGIWYISLTVICSSGTFTAQVGNIEEIR